MDGGLIHTLLRERFKRGILPLGRIPRDCSFAPCHAMMDSNHYLLKYLSQRFKFFIRKVGFVVYKFIEKYYDIISDILLIIF
jgi:hypothetical protein